MDKACQRSCGFRPCRCGKRWKIMKKSIYFVCNFLDGYISLLFFCGEVQPLQVGIVARYRVFVVGCMYLFLFNYMMVSIFKTHLLYRFGRCHGNNWQERLLGIWNIQIKEKADCLTGHADSQQLHTPWKNDGWKIALVLGWSLLRGELLNFGGVFDTTHTIHACMVYFTYIYHKN